MDQKTVHLPRPSNPPRFRKRHGRCFELAYKYQESDPTWTLVHGWVDGPGGERMTHAWLERDNVVFDPVLNDSFAFDVYRNRYAAVSLVRYSRVEAARCVVETGHSGPWSSLIG